MPGLYDLPVELLSQIGENLDDDDDFLALRLASGKLNHVFREMHMSSLYKSRRVFTMKASVENLIKVSKNPTANYRVEHLVISDRPPYPPDLRRFPMRIIPWLEPLTGSNNDPQGLFPKITDYINDEQDLSTSSASAEWTALFAIAFTNLPNIRSIKLESPPLALTRKEYNLFYPGLELGPGKRIPVKLDETAGRYYPERHALSGKTWPRLLSAVYVARLSKIEAISTGYELPGKWFRRPETQYIAFGSLFKNLTHLDLKIGLDWEDCLSFNELPFLNSDWLCKWLSSLGGSLKSLLLCCNMSRYEPRNGQPLLIKKCQLPNLETFGVTDGLLENEDLKLFIWECKGTLRSLVFDGCYLDQEDRWDEIFEYISKECRGLRALQRDGESVLACQQSFG
ncbi:hypothetical protein TWF694_005153 [Orbilia ellipsospora]|uniref:F-box domain-containing protein n=1 Tax=Orbilia ellipsospora TaxID=2528407 RepID=A0AAV9WXA2_9PEZI